MKALKILTAAVVATFAVATYAADPYGPGRGGPTGATPGSADCPAYGTGAGARGTGLTRWDANGDGQLSRDEVANAPRLSQEFDAVDANHDGFLSRTELQAARAARGFGGRGGGVARWDANGDGQLSRDEVANAPRLSQEFDTIDANHDGFVTVEELQAARGQFAGRGGRRGS